MANKLAASLSEATTCVGLRRRATSPTWRLWERATSFTFFVRLTPARPAILHRKLKVYHVWKMCGVEKQLPFSSCARHSCARAVLSFSVSFQNFNGWSRRDSTWQSCRKKRPRPKVQGSLHHSFLAALIITALATVHRDVRRCSIHLARVELATFSVLG